MKEVFDHMSTEIFVAKSDEEVLSCFLVLLLLRPHLKKEVFLSQVRRQQEQLFQLVGLRVNGEVKSVIGFREAEYLIWGKIVYVDDLSTIDEGRGKGYAGQLLDWVIAYAKNHQCSGVHLDTGYSRHVAHRFYLNRGFSIGCHHLFIEF
jgi:GNAT superfamily N-acetyltransferase